MSKTNILSPIKSYRIFADTIQLCLREGKYTPNENAIKLHSYMVGVNPDANFLLNRCISYYLFHNFVTQCLDGL